MVLPGMRPWSSLTLVLIRSTRSRRSLSQHPWWSWRSCQEVSSLSLSHPQRSHQYWKAVSLLLSTGKRLFSCHAAPWPMLSPVLIALMVSVPPAMMGFQN